MNSSPEPVVGVPGPVLLALEFRLFSDGFEHISDPAASLAATPGQDVTATVANGRTATTVATTTTTTTTTAAATKASAADPGPGSGRSSHPSRHSPTTALQPAPPAPSLDDADATPSSPSPPAPDGSPCFPRFPDLPPELRLRVWEDLIQPRILMVACCPLVPATHPDRHSKLAQMRARRLAASPSSSAAPYTSLVPALLHVCRESRDLALRHYEPAFESRAPIPLAMTAYAADCNRSATPPPQAAAATATARVYFNFALDALYLMGALDRVDELGLVDSVLPDLLDLCDTKRVRHVAVALEELRPRARPVGGEERVGSSLYHIIEHFSGAERLLIACTSRDVEEGREQQQQQQAGSRRRASGSPSLLAPLLGEENVLQKIWRSWLSGTSVVSSTLRNKKILMMREEELQSFIRAHL